jgi:hypothetical protein
MGEIDRSMAKPTTSWSTTPTAKSGHHPENPAESSSWRRAVDWHGSCTKPPDQLVEDPMQDYATDRPAAGEGPQRLLRRASAWLEARTTDQWLMFLAGLALGLLLG